MSRYHTHGFVEPGVQRITPIFDLPSPVQSPTTGISPARPKLAQIRSPPNSPSHCPLLFRSMNQVHGPIAAEAGQWKTPYLTTPAPSQSPATGTSLSVVPGIP